MFTVEGAHGEISETDHLSGAMHAAAIHVAEGEGAVRILEDGREVGAAAQITAVDHQDGRTDYAEFVVVRVKKEELAC